MEHFTFLVAAYSAIFVVIFLYVLFVWRRQAALEAQLREMEERMKELNEGSRGDESLPSRHP